MAIADHTVELKLDTSQLDEALERSEEKVDRLIAKIERLHELQERTDG